MSPCAKAAKMRQSRCALASASVLRETGPAKPQVIQALGERAEGRFDIAETLAVRELGEDQHEELIPVAEAPRRAAGVIARHALLKRAVRGKLQQLREDRAPTMHPSLRSGSAHDAESCRRIQIVSPTQRP
jgi:hypothetical protein